MILVQTTPGSQLKHRYEKEIKETGLKSFKSDGNAGRKFNYLISILSQEGGRR